MYEKKISRYGYKIPKEWVECRGCRDIINENILSLYTYGYCPNCVNEIPDYIPTSQWEKFLNEKFG